MIPTDSVTTSYTVSSPFPLPAKPAAERLVVVLEQQPCKQWTDHDDGHCQGPLGGHKVRVDELAVEAKASEEDEHEGIVNGIEGVRNVAQKATSPLDGFAGTIVRSCQPDDGWEQEGNTKNRSTAR